MSCEDVLTLELVAVVGRATVLENEEELEEMLAAVLINSAEDSS